MTEDEKIWEEEIKREAEYDSVSAYLEKQKRIKKELSRLKRIFKEIDENKKKLVESTMEDLRENIIRDGTTVEYKNGENQYGNKQSPDAQLYLQMSQKHTQAMKVLLECMPKTKLTEVKDDGFDAFVAGR